MSPDAGLAHASKTTDLAGRWRTLSADDDARNVKARRIAAGVCRALYGDRVLASLTGRVSEMRKFRRRMARLNFRRLVQAARAVRLPFTGCSPARRHLGIERSSLQTCGMTPETIARLRISLNDIEPAIWRTIDMPVTGSLKMLHDVIQAAMGWEDSHLWHFEAGNRHYGLPNPEWADRDLTNARNVKFGFLIDQGICQLTYTYDMGDDWRHTIVVEAVGPADPDIEYPRFVAGERRRPPEDVGGSPGFERFIEAMNDPAHREHQHLRQWHGGPFDRDDLDVLAAKRAVAAIAIRRYAGKAAYEKSRARH